MTLLKSFSSTLIKPCSFAWVLQFQLSWTTDEGSLSFYSTSYFAGSCSSGETVFTLIDFSLLISYWLAHVHHPFLKMLKSILSSLLLWSLESLLPVQESSLKEFLEGWNVFVNLPTSYRKSLIFQCLPISADALLDKPCSSSLVVVISFLQSLMEDQVLFLNNTGVPAITITDEEDPHIVQQVINGNYIAVYGLPESLLCTVSWGSIFSCNTIIEMLIGVAIDYPMVCVSYISFFIQRYSNWQTTIFKTL